MSGFVYSKPTYDSTIYNPWFYNSLLGSDYLTFDNAKAYFLLKNDYRLNYLSLLSDITNGSASANKALILDSNQNISGLNIIDASYYKQNGNTINFANIPYLDGVTPGTVSASKAIIVDSNRDITNFRNLSLTGDINSSGSIYLSAGTLSCYGLTTNLAAVNCGNLYTHGKDISTTNGHLYAGSGNVYCGTLEATNLTGLLTTAAQSNITSTGTLTGLSLSGDINSTASIYLSAGTLSCYGLTTNLAAVNCGNLYTHGKDISTTNGHVYAGSGNVYCGTVEATNLKGLLTTAAQSNITSLGSLTGLSLTGDINSSGSIYLSAGTLSCYGLTTNLAAVNCGNLYTHGKDISTTNGNIYVGSGSIESGAITASGVTKITNTTASTLYTNGSLVVSGGLGIAGDIRCNGTVYGAIGGSISSFSCSGISYVTNNTNSSTYTNGCLVLSGGLGVAGNINTAGNISANYVTTGGFNSTSISYVTNSTNSSAYNNGCLVLSGGLGVAGNIINAGVIYSRGLDTQGYNLTGGNTRVNGSFDMYGNMDCHTYQINNAYQVGATKFLMSSYIYSGSASTSATFCSNWPSSAYWGLGYHGSSNATRLGMCDTAGNWNGSYSDCYLYYKWPSDYRLKNNVKNLEYGLDELKKLRPVSYELKQNSVKDKDKTVSEIQTPRKDIGFIAHELQEIIPEAVTGEKDAVNKDGVEIHQGIAYPNLVTLLIKSVQQLDDKVIELATIVATRDEDVSRLTKLVHKMN